MYGYIDGFLSPTVYDHLSRHFPAVKVMFATDDSEPWPDIDHGWIDLAKQMSSPEFLADLNAYFDGFLGTAEIRVRFKLSHLAPGDSIEPHTDNPRKLASMILYFADEGWLPVYGGGTEMYVPRSLSGIGAGDEANVSPQHMRLAEVIEFVPNRLAFLCKSDRSWHGVSTVKCPPGMTRKTMLISVERSKPAGKSLHQRLLRLVMRAREAAVGRSRG